VKNIFTKVFLVTLAFFSLIGGAPAKAARAADLWDGEGMLPYMNYLNNNEEYVSPYKRTLTVIANVFSLKGNGPSLSLSRCFSPYGVPSGIGSFQITSNWYWDLLYYSKPERTLHLPGGATFIIPNIEGENGYPVECGGTVVKVYRQEKMPWMDKNEVGYVNAIEFPDGTILRDYRDDNYQTITDPNGNTLRYDFKNLDYKPNKYTTITYHLISSITDAAGRKIVFTHVWKNNIPFAKTATYVYGKTSRIISSLSTDTATQCDFRDVLNRTTSYKMFYAIDYNKSYIVKINYPNGSFTEFTYENTKVKTQKYSYRNKTRLLTYEEKSRDNPIDNTTDKWTQVTLAGVKITNYFYDSKGYLEKEEVTSLTGDFQKSTRIEYYINSWKYVSRLSLTKYITYMEKICKPKLVEVITANRRNNPGKSRITKYEYDDWGNTVKITDPNNTVTCIVYNNTSSTNLELRKYGFQSPRFKANISSHDRPATKATLIVDSVHGTRELSQSHYNYDKKGNLVQESVYHKGSYLDTYYSYDGKGNQVYKKDANGNELWYEYSGAYASQYLTRIYNQNTGFSHARYEYDFHLGKPSSFIDANGVRYSYTYDASGRILTETLNADDATAAYTKTLTYYDSENRIYQKFGNANSYQEGQVYFDELTGKPRLIQRKISGYWQTPRETDFDCNGRPQWEKDGLGHTTRHDYDALDREVKTTLPDGAATTYSWDDRVLTITDPNGNRKILIYDLLDRVVKEQVFPDAATTYTTTYEYDSASQLIRATNPRGAATTYTYDNLGRPVRVDYPQDGANPMASEEYAYDNVGNLTAKTGSNGIKSIAYEFFAGYRIKQVAEPDGRVIFYTYDANNNPLSQSWGNNSYNYTYDARNRVTEFSAILDGVYFKLGYAYDIFSRVIGMNYPGRSGTVSYTYDELDRLRTIPGFVSSCEYDGDGKLLKMKLANDLYNVYSYDANDRIANINVNKAYTTIIFRSFPVKFFEKSETSSIKASFVAKELLGSSSVTGTSSNVSSSSSNSVTYANKLFNLDYTYDKAGNITGLNEDCFEYDGLNRLTWSGNQSKAQVLGGASWGEGTSWSYDGAGNRVAQQSYDNGKAGEKAALGYDLANRLWNKGEIVYENDAAGSRTAKNTGSDAWTYAYDGESRLVRAAKNEAILLENGYDPAGMRVKKASDGRTVYTIYSGANPLYEYDPDTGKYTYFIYVGTRLIAEEKGGVKTFYHRDHLGSTRATTDENGKITGLCKYDVWGKLETTNEYDEGIINGDFELRTSYGVIQCWTKVNASDGECNYLQGVGIDGGSVLEAKRSKGTAAIGWRNQYKYVSPDTDYELTGYYKSGNKTSVPQVVVNFYEISSKSLSLVSSTEWTAFTFTFHTPANATVMEIKLLESGETVGAETFFDKIKLKIPGLSGKYDYTGKKEDDETGLKYFGARFYDPETGRFLTLDPVKDGANWYSYCNDNPVGMVDPDGKCPLFAITGAAGALIGGGYGAYTSYMKTGRVDWGTVGKDAAIGGLIGVGAGALAGALYAGTTAAITIATESGVGVWGLSAVQRGQVIERALGGMCSNFPVIDKFVNGANGIASSITSIKSMDLGAASYQKGNAVFNTIMGYANKLADFGTTTWNYITVNVGNSTQRVLQLVIPEGATAAQQAQIQAAIKAAVESGVQITVTTAK